jgi:hypothetical protein
MALSTAARNSQLDALDETQATTLEADFMSLHTADPGTTGANEVAGGAPAYARKAVTWAAAGSGTKAMSAALTFDVPAGTTVAYIGLWTAVSAGTWIMGSTALAVPRAFTNQGTLEVSTATLAQAA